MLLYDSSTSHSDHLISKRILRSLCVPYTLWTSRRGSIPLASDNLLIHLNFTVLESMQIIHTGQLGLMERVISFDTLHVVWAPCFVYGVQPHQPALLASLRN